MYKQAEQLEIFSSKDNYSSRPRNFGRIFLMHILAHEKTVLFIIAFLVVALISFSLGVERGKKISLRKTNDNSRNLASRKMPDKQHNLAAQTMQVKPRGAQKTNQNLSVPATKQIAARFTVQVASHKTKTAALREADILKKKGFSATILPKGNYIIVCVGNYSNKEKAKVSQRKLMKAYPDCLIRRL